MPRFLFLVTALLTLITASTTADAASCCGGGFASPSLIVGDDRASISADLSLSNIATEVSSAGLWQDRSTSESLETLRLQGAHIFLDRFQIGATVPVIRRSRGGANSTGFGDLALNLGYEILPEWDYSQWRPRGVSYVSLVAPTGRAVQDSTDPLQLDARGRGFWAVGVGTTLAKAIGKYDFNTTLEVHRSFAREMKTPLFAGELRPGHGAQFGIGAGYNIGDTRVGASLTFNYEDAIETVGAVSTISSSGSSSRFATAGLSVSQMFGEAWAVSFAYSDQTLFGMPLNTTLARTVGLTAQHRFSR